MVNATAAFALLLSLLASLRCCCCSANQTEFNCSYVSDGKYSHPDQPCSPVFYHCFQQVTTKMKCPDSLYFDVFQEICLPRKEVQACFNEPIPESALDCKILADGQYPDISANCSRKYYKCLAGVTTFFACPGEYLYYDAEKKQCVPYTEVEECSSLSISVDCTTLLSSGAQRQSIADNACSEFFINCENNSFGKISKCKDGLFFNPIKRSCDLNSNIEVCNISLLNSKTDYEHSTAASNSFNSYSTCSNMAEGMNPIALNVCSQFYIYCQQNSTPILMKCSYELYFDSDQNRCVHKKVSKICNIRSGYKNETEQSFINFPVRCSDQMVVGKHAISDDSCSQFYIECENDSDFPIATFKKCKDTLLFDPKNKNCAREEKITSCQLEHHSSTAEQSIYNKNRTNEFDCHGIGDGNYSISGKGCFNFYYQCIDEVAFKLFCLSELYFDPVLRICSPYENIAYCNQESKLPPKMSMKEANFCSPSVNENYPDPLQNCSSKYYTCFNGYLIQRHCELGKYYDVQSDKCDLFRMVPACSRFGRSNNLRTLSTEAAPTTASSSSLTTLSFNCENLPDGNWAASACKPYYFACVGGFSFMQPCPSGTYYDPDTDQCNYKSAIPLCGEIVEWISISPLSTTDQPAATATPAPAIVTATTSTAAAAAAAAAATTTTTTNYIYSTLSVDCKNLPNGYYADPRNSCSKIYFLCDNGNDFMFYCVGARLFYDPDNGMCDDKAHVVACGGSARGTAASASPLHQGSSTMETTQQPTRPPVSTLKTTHFPNIIRTRKLTNRIIKPTQSTTGERRRTSSSSTVTTKGINIPTRAMMRTTQSPPVVRTRKTVHPWRRITTIKPTHLSSVDALSIKRTTPSPLITASASATNTSPRDVVKPFVVSLPEIGRVTKAPLGSNQQAKETHSVQSQHSFSFQTKTSFQNRAFTGYNNTVISTGNNWISIFQRELSADGSIENSRYFLRTRQRAKPARLGTRKPVVTQNYQQ
ncbi:Chondroitin proteoglycan 1 [Trichinella pseudospiralis]|uniref:Chondroitin proteoglycan 1 n=1 Tax=Trichinella pseudospiralis TaxID=6337 RepID=A0A0V1F7M1_TRIPS|nr:Chondroitin proteoglycan 1 [Trichinella pseudospiralis]